MYIHENHILFSLLLDKLVKLSTLLLFLKYLFILSLGSILFPLTKFWTVSALSLVA